MTKPVGKRGEDKGKRRCRLKRSVLCGLAFLVFGYEGLSCRATEIHGGTKRPFELNIR